MNSQLDVYNKALGRVVQKKTTSLSAVDRGTESCNNYYDSLRKTILRRHPWNFAGDVEQLIPFYALADLAGAPTLDPVVDVNDFPSWASGAHVLSHDGTDTWTYDTGSGTQTVSSTEKIPPTTGWSGGLVLDFPVREQDEIVGWTRSYRMPDDAVRVKELKPSGSVTTGPVFGQNEMKYQAVESRGQHKTEFEIYRDKMIVTNMEGAYASCTFDVTDLTDWDDCAYEYLWRELAASICMELTGKQMLHRTVLQELVVIRSQAPATNANEKHKKVQRHSSLIDARLR